jgi:hypothetical protein
MMRLALALALVFAACSSPSKPAAQTAGSGGAPLPAQKVLLSWGIQQQGSSADVFLQTTDEMGKQVSHPVGTYQGQCAPTTAAAEMKAVIAVSCKDGATGIELHAVVDDAAIVVLKMKVDDGVAPDPMSREEVTRVQAPAGAAISAAG